MMAIANGLQNLKRQHPEWTPWLAVVEVILREIGDSKWDTAVPGQVGPQQSTVPFLAGTAFKLEQIMLHRLFAELVRIASRSGTEKMATLKSVSGGRMGVLDIFRASLNHDDDAMKKIASSVGADSDALQAVAALLPMPILHACNRRWKPSESWVEGYCPICGAWPAFAEVRGIERSRYFRCGRCGSEWQAQPLSCPYCTMSDHNELASLVPEQIGAKSVIDACNRCQGYVKALTKLQGSPPAQLIIDDLASVDLDIAALEHGYRRPQGAGYSLNVSVDSEALPNQAILSWGL
jgi:FdhE protein